MNRAAEIAGHWLGLCRKPPAVRALQTQIYIPPEPDHERAAGGGGAGIPGMVRRGMEALFSGTRTLIHNPQLLWFAFFVMLVLAGHFIAQGMISALYQSIGSSEIAAGSDPAGLFIFSVTIEFFLTFAVEIATVICLVFLLAGLVLSLSLPGEGPISLFRGMKKTKEHARTLIRWSGIVAFTGSLIFILTWIYPFSLVTILWDPLFRIFDSIPVSYILSNLNQYAPGLGDIWWQWGGIGSFTQTQILSLINLLLFILTLFVVPLIVQKKRGIKRAVLESFALMKKTWGGVITCVLGLAITAYAASFTFPLFQAAAGLAASPLTWFRDDWAAAGLLYAFFLFCFGLVLATIGAIAALDLYRSTGEEELPRSAGDVDTA